MKEHNEGLAMATFKVIFSRFAPIPLLVIVYLAVKFHNPTMIFILNLLAGVFLIISFVVEGMLKRATLKFEQAKNILLFVYFTIPVLVLPAFLEKSHGSFEEIVPIYFAFLFSSIINGLIVLARFKQKELVDKPWIRAVNILLGLIVLSIYVLYVWM